MLDGHVQHPPVTVEVDSRFIPWICNFCMIELASNYFRRGFLRVLKCSCPTCPTINCPMTEPRPYLFCFRSPSRLWDVVFSFGVFWNAVVCGVSSRDGGEAIEFLCWNDMFRKEVCDYMFG